MGMSIQNQNNIRPKANVKPVAEVAPKPSLENKGKAHKSARPVEGSKYEVKTPSVEDQNAAAFARNNLNKLETPGMRASDLVGQFNAGKAAPKGEVDSTHRTEGTKLDPSKNPDYTQEQLNKVAKSIDMYEGLRNISNAEERATIDDIAKNGAGLGTDDDFNEIYEYYKKNDGKLPPKDWATDPKDVVKTSERFQKELFEDQSDKLKKAVKNLESFAKKGKDVTEKLKDLDDRVERFSKFFQVAAKPFEAKDKLNKAADIADALGTLDNYKATGDAYREALRGNDEAAKQRAREEFAMAAGDTFHRFGKAGGHLPGPLGKYVEGMCKAVADIPLLTAKLTNNKINEIDKVLERDQVVGKDGKVIDYSKR